MANMKNLKRIAKISKVTGFTKLCYFLNKNRKRVIAYHNIIPDKYFDDSLHLSHSMKESSFKAQLEIIRKRFKISTDINDVKSVTLTFDDGYFNQYEIASKIMDRYNIKGYFFCIVDLINKQELILMDMLQYWISYVPSGSYFFKELNLTLELNTRENRKAQWNKISQMLNLGVSQGKIKEEFEKAFSFEKIFYPNKRFYKLRFNPILKSNLITMRDKGHLIGAHSAQHKRLALMSEVDIEEDISLCKKELNKLFNTKVFAYPYGSAKDISPKVIEELKKAGFEKAFAYSSGPLKAIKYNKFFMPRMFLADTSDKELIDFTLSGAKHFISFRRLLPKWE